MFLTDFVRIALSADRVHPSPKPESWRIGPLVKVAVVLGALMLLEALALLALGWRRFDLGGSRLHTFSFLPLLFFALFSIVSVRERRAFWRSRPGWVLVAALSVDALLGLAVGSFGLAGLRPLPLGQTAFIVGYALVCALGPNDLVKSILTRRLWTARSCRSPQLDPRCEG